MSFKDVLCQERAVGSLQHDFAAGRVPHAYIFAGADGVGKFRTAREWARLLLCSNPVTADNAADSCGSCESCRLFDSDSHPDFGHVYKELRKYTRDGKGKPPPADVPIDVVREFLIEKVSARPIVSSRRIFVVSEAEKLSNSAQNCLLKVLEEPPAFCCIILLCTRLDNLLPTTRSRSRIVRFGPVAHEIIVTKVRDMGLKAAEAGCFASIAEGSLGQACLWARLELADAGLYRAKCELVKYLAALRLEYAPDNAARLLAEAKRIAKLWADMGDETSTTDITRTVIGTLIRMVIMALRDAITTRVTPEKAIGNCDQQGHISEIAARFTLESLTEMVGECFRMLQWIEAGVNQKLIFEQLLLNIARSDRMHA